MPKATSTEPSYGGTGSIAGCANDEFSAASQVGEQRLRIG
jgi:hypothetical protein